MRWACTWMMLALGACGGGRWRAEAPHVTGPSAQHEAGVRAAPEERARPDAGAASRASVGHGRDEEVEAAAEAPEPPRAIRSNAAPPPRMPCRAAGPVVVRAPTERGDSAFFRSTGDPVRVGVVLHRVGRAAVAIPAALLQAGRDVCRSDVDGFVGLLGAQGTSYNDMYRILRAGVLGPRARSIEVGQPISLSLQLVIESEARTGEVMTLVIPGLSGRIERPPAPP